MSRAAVPIPGRLARRPRDKHGRPVPWFAVQTGPAEWDLRVADGQALRAALRYKLCWVCGFPFDRQEERVFVIGPMCAVNRTSAEPPCHEDCALYSVLACPFLTTPVMKRRDRHLPEGTENPGGVMIYRNPGAEALWVTRYNGWSKRPDLQGGFVFDVGEPLRVSWWALGRPATRAEVQASFDSGLPALQEVADAEGPGARDQLAALLDRALGLLPEEAA